MSLLSAFLDITAGLARRLPAATHLRSRRCVRRSVLWCAWGGAVCRASSGATAASSAAGAQSISCIRAVSWEPQQLFAPHPKRALARCPQRLVGVAIDDTRLRKTGRSIPQAFYQRDPLSPPFHRNLLLGLRFLQASLLVPLHRASAVGARALPIVFEEVSREQRRGTAGQRRDASSSIGKP